MSLRFYFDHDSGDRRVVNALRARGIDVLTSQEAANQRLNDEQQLEFAFTNHRAIYSANVQDFARLHQSWLGNSRAHAGIVLRVNQTMPVGEQVHYLSIVASGPREMASELVYLGPWLEHQSD